MTARRPNKPPSAARAPLVRMEDVRGGIRLAVHGIQGVTHIAEGLHANIARVAPPLGVVEHRPAGGIAGLVYRAVRGTAGLVGAGLDAALAGMQALLPPPPADPATAPQQASQRDAIVAAINGIVGDHLERTGNPLAIPMQLLPAGPARPRLLLLVHGLCMNEQQWARGGRDYGQALAKALDATPVYLRYNSGRHISENGAQLAGQLEELLAHWPTQVEALAIIGHSMGGLVARSAAHQGQRAGMAWPALLRQLVFLGTPHHGAALERGGNWLHAGLGLSPYLAPFARLGGLRSAGITDLRHGSLLEGDWDGGRFVHRDTRAVVPLPPGVECYAVAGTLSTGRTKEPLGDGLVSVASALGRHARATRDLHLPASHTFTARGTHHLGLLASPAVYRQLRRWLAPPPGPTAK